MASADKKDPYSMVKAMAATIAASTFYARPAVFLNSQWCVMINGHFGFTIQWFEDEQSAEDCKLRMNSYAMLAALGSKSGRSKDAKLLSAASAAMSHLLSAFKKGESNQVILRLIDAVNEADDQFVAYTTGEK